MTSFEFAYLCFATGAFIFFGIALAGAVHYSNSKPQESRQQSRAQDRQISSSSTSVHA